MIAGLYQNELPAGRALSPEPRVSLGSFGIQNV
jgi:hypothetical protein